jgi:hypothetical protein
MTTNTEHSDEHDGFSESWLTLREPADHAARSMALTDQLVATLAMYKTKCIVELGAGTGSNLRFLMPLLGHEQHWLLVDNDARLLEHLPRILQPWVSIQNASLTQTETGLHVTHANFSATINTQIVNLATHLHTVDLQDVNLVTASALLDLTSAPWLDALAKAINEHQCCGLFALNYNGDVTWNPQLQNDDTVTSLLNEHQLKDKGFGAALGPSAGDYFAKKLSQLGHNVMVEPSNWDVQASSDALQRAIIDGWAPAAIEQDGSMKEIILQWHSARADAIQQGLSHLHIGHVDVLCLR